MIFDADSAHHASSYITEGGCVGHPAGWELGVTGCATAGIMGDRRLATACNSTGVGRQYVKSSTLTNYRCRVSLIQITPWWSSSTMPPRTIFARTRGSCYMSGLRSAVCTRPWENMGWTRVARCSKQTSASRPRGNRSRSLNRTKTLSSSIESWPPLSAFSINSKHCLSSYKYQRHSPNAAFQKTSAVIDVSLV